MMMQDNTENLQYFYFEFQDPRNGNKITKTLPMTQEVMEQVKELSKLTEQYNEDFCNLFDKFCPQFDERLSAIGGWIAPKYDNILPTKKEFINWFIRTKIGTYTITPHFKLNDNEEYDIEYIDWWFPDYKNTFIPNLIDDYLLEYCQEYVNNLELKRKKILLQLSTPAPEEIGQVKVKREQKGGNEVGQLEKQKQIDIFKNAVNELCTQNRGKQKNDRLNLSQITNLALSTKGIKSYKTLDRHITYLNLGRTHKEYSGQLVRQYCKDNSLNINYFK